MSEFVKVGLEYKAERIFRRIKIEPGTYVHEYAMKAFPKLEKLVKERLRMTSCYQVLDEPLFLGIQELDSCERQVVCLTSCGPEIVEMVDKLLSDGDYLEGYILNQMISEILFSGADQMNRQIENRMAAEGRHLTRSYFPGEGAVPLELQRTLLDCFRGESLLEHIRLTESFMLIPEKSMLYVFGADSRLSGHPITHDCANCENMDCFLRE